MEVNVAGSQAHFTGQHPSCGDHRASGWAATASGLELRLQECWVIVLFALP